MSRAIREDAIVLKSINYGDNHRIFTLLTPNHGKVSAFASYARKSQKRFGSALDLFCLISAELKPSSDKNSGLWKMMQSEILELNLELRKDFLKLSSYSYLCECLVKLIPEGESQSELFTWLKERTHHMRSNPLDALEVLYTDYSLLSYCGYCPQLTKCDHCDKELKEQKCYFSYETGSAYCGGCFPGTQGSWFASSPELIQFLSSGERVLKIDPTDVKKMFFLLQEFTNYTLGGKLKSQDLRWEAFYGFR